MDEWFTFAANWYFHIELQPWKSKLIKTVNEYLKLFWNLSHTALLVTRCALGRTAQSRCSFQHLPKRNNLHGCAHIKRQLHKHDPLTTEIAINRSQALRNNVNVGRRLSNFPKAICTIFKKQHYINSQTPDPSTSRREMEVVEELFFYIVMQIQV